MINQNQHPAKQEHEGSKELISVAFITDNYYGAEDVIAKFPSEDGIAVSGIFRAYHADGLTQESAPDIIVSNGKTKDRIPVGGERDLPRPVIVAYDAKSRAKELGVPYVRQRLTAKGTERAIRRAAKKIVAHRDKEA